MPDDPPLRGAGDLQLVIPADANAVRAALKSLFQTLMLRNLPPERRSTAELVLAEALNNIVEHAYCRGSGQICLTLHLCRTGLLCRIEDTGAPMPGETLPRGEAHLYDETGELAEGGFGWHLIRSLSRDLRYRRLDGRNLLSFRLDAEQSLRG